ncbi:MAG: hypothetical protein ACW967_01910 [Candidatus Hodarchaeales archaeon]|jgi:hypothetical protein
MISGIAKAIKQFTNQLRDVTEEVTGTLTIIWVDYERQNYKLKEIISLDHEYTQKDGTLILKGRRRVAKGRDAGFFITTKIKHIYSLNLVIEKVPDDFEMFNK